MAGSGSIRKFGDKRYQVRVTLGTDASGKRNVHTKTIHGTKREAEVYLATKLKERDSGTFSEPTKMTVDAYLDKWLEAAAKPRLRDRTFTDYQEILRRYVRPRIGSTALERTTPLALQALYSDLLGEGLSASTVRKMHAVLHNALKQAVRWRLLPHNPAQDVDLPRLERHEMAALDSSAAARFIDAARQDPRGLVYLVALATGMRPAEYLALQWPDLNLETGTVHIQRTLYRPRKGGGWRFEEAKTARSRRTVILPKTLLSNLREHRARQNEQRLLLGSLWENRDLVFTTEMGAPLDGGNMNQRHFKLILKAAGLPETLRPYDLRHSCATLLLEAGKSPKIVAERLGHASTVMTMDVYSHVTPGMQQDAADALDGILFGGAPSGAGG